MIFKSLLAGATAAVALLTVSGAVAQTPAEFFKGKTIELYIAYSAGGGYDLYARMVARHIGKHIPGNPHGGGRRTWRAPAGLRLANWLYKRRRRTAR